MHVLNFCGCLSSTQSDRDARTRLTMHVQNVCGCLSSTQSDRDARTRLTMHVQNVCGCLSSTQSDRDARTHLTMHVQNLSTITKTLEIEGHHSKQVLSGTSCAGYLAKLHTISKTLPIIVTISGLPHRQREQ
jgi:hypothetical protein